MSENKGRWSKMSEKAKSIMSGLYKGINKIPVVDRMMAKVGVAYNQYWIDSKEGSAAGLKEKMDELDIEMKTFNQSKASMLSVAENLRATGNPGFASMALEIKKLEKEEVKMANKRDKIQSKFEIKENKIKLYTNKRDAIADRMINTYEKNLAPMEEKLNFLQEERDRTNLFALGKEAEFDEQKSLINYFSEQREIIIRSLISTGKSTDQAQRNNAVKSLDKQILSGNRKIEKARGELRERQDLINRKIDTVDAKAQPHRDRRNQFIRVKSGRPIDFNVERRTEMVNTNKYENVYANTREKSELNSSNPNKLTPESSLNKPYSYEGVPQIGELITNFNKYLLDNGAKTNLQINMASLLNGLEGKSKESRVTLAIFREMIKIYYKINKVPESDYTILLNNLK